MKLRNNYILTVLSFIFILLLAACGDSNSNSETQTNVGNNDDSTNGEETTDEREGWPETFVYGIQPAEDQETLSRRYEPFGEFLEQELGMPVEMFQGTDFTAMIEAMRNGHIHATKYGSFAYIIAAERAGAEAFVQGVQNADEPTYNSILITRESTGIETLEDLEGANFAFVDPASTSGHLFPRAMLINQLGIPNDEIEDMFGTVLFAGNHDGAFISLINGDVDAAAVCERCYERTYENYLDHENIDDMKILAYTDPIPQSPEAIQKDLPESFKQAVKEAFLKMKDEPSLDEFMEDHNYFDGFVDISDSSYDIIRETSAALEMSPDDLLN